MEKILIFEISKSRDYWFKYVVKELEDKCFLGKVYYHAKEIWFNGNRIMFKTLREITDQNGYDKFTIIYTNMEYRLEKNFKETMEEIFLDGESRN